MDKIQLAFLVIIIIAAGVVIFYNLELIEAEDKLTITETVRKNQVSFFTDYFCKQLTYERDGKFVEFGGGLLIIGDGKEQSLCYPQECQLTENKTSKTLDCKGYEDKILLFEWDGYRYVQVVKNETS